MGTATLLFTDLVGSTALRSRLGEDAAAEALRSEHDRLGAGAIEAERGRVVKSLGDGLMAVFDASADAVVRLGSEDQRAEMVRLGRIAERSHVLTGGFYGGAATRFVALLEDSLGRPEAADAAFAEAVADHTRIQSPPWLARTHLDWAESLLARGEIDRATPSSTPPRRRWAISTSRVPHPTGRAPFGGLRRW